MVRKLGISDYYANSRRPNDGVGTMRAHELVNEALEIEFVCVNDSFPDATKQEQQDELFASLREVPGVLVYRQDFGEHNSMAVIVRDEDSIPEIKRLAQENGVAIDMYSDVSERFIDSIYNNTLEGFVDWYASD